MRDNKLQELYELKDKQENQITFFNEWVVKEKKLVLNDKKEEPKKFKVKYKSLDDTLIVNGYIMNKYYFN